MLIGGSSLISIDRRRFVFKTTQIYFSDHVYDVKGVSSVRFTACKRFEEVSGFICSRAYTSCIDLTQDLEAIWGNMHKTSCRNAIKRAEKKDVRVKVNENYEEFYKIYRPFWRSTKQKGLPERLKTLRKYGTLFTAEYHDELLTGSVYLEGDSAILYWISANKRLSSKDAKKKTLIGNASHLMIWEAIKYAKQRGLAEFDLGGLWVEKGDNYPGYSLDAFKKHFGGKTVLRYAYYKDYNRIIALTRKILNAKQRHIR